MALETLSPTRDPQPPNGAALDVLDVTEQGDVRMGERREDFRFAAEARYALTVADRASGKA